MKRIYAILFAVLLFSTANAKSNLGIKIYTGFTNPSFSNELDNERTVGAIVGVGLDRQINRRLSIGTSFQYSNMQIDNNGIISSLNLPSESTLVNGNVLQVFSFSANASLAFPGKNESPALSYIYLSPKLNMWHENDIVVETSEKNIVFEKSNQNIFALEAGIGLEIRLEQTILFVEVGAETNFLSSQKALITPIRLGVIIEI